MNERTFGQRVMEMREEAKLSQKELAALCPPYTRNGKTTKRTSSWVSRIELGQNEPSISDLLALASALRTDVRYLLIGEASGLTEFIAQVIEIDLQIGDRERRTILNLARQQVDEYQRALEQSR